MAYNNKITVTSLTSPLATGLLKSTTGTGELTIAVNSDLPAMTATVGGAVPTPPNNTTTFLRGDGTFAAPAGGSGDITNGGNTTGATVVIGTNDANALSLETNNVERVSITGGASTGGAMTLTNVTANTSAVQDVLIARSNSTGVAAAGFGMGVLFQQESSTTNNRDAVKLTTPWTNATDGNQTADLEVYTSAGGALQLNAKFRGLFADLLIGAASQAAYKANGITTAQSYTVGNSASALTLGGNSGTITISTSNTASFGPTILVNSTGEFTNGGIGIQLGNASYTGTSLNKTSVHIADGYAVASGSGTMNSLFVGGTFNQTSTATGIIKGIVVSPTLTSITGAYRAIEIGANNSLAKGIYQTGTSTTNNFVGNTMFGSTTTPTGQLEVDNAANARSILIARDNGSAVFTIADGGGITSTSTGRHTFTSSNSTTSGAIELIPTSLTAGTDIGVKITGAAFTASGNDNKVVQITSSYTRATGASGAVTSLAINPTANLTGSASGGIIGIDVSPTLTSLASGNFYGLYLNYSDAKAWGVYQNGANTVNAFQGKTAIGSTTTPTESLNITGNMLVAGQYASTSFAATDAAPVAINWNNGNVQYVTIAANRTVTFANPKEGARYVLAIKQPAGGSKTITWPTITWRGGTAPTLTTTANKTDLITLIYINGVYYGDASLNY